MLNMSVIDCRRIVWHMRYRMMIRFFLIFDGLRSLFVVRKSRTDSH